MSVKQISLWGAAWLLSAISLVGAAHAPLADAAETMDRESIRALLRQSVDLNARQADGMTALHWAARHDDLEIAQLLVRAGAVVNTATRYGVTPLTLACTNGNQRLVELLLEAGADPNTTLPGGETVLMTAARTGRLGPVKALLTRGADVRARVRGKGRREEPGDIVVAAASDPSIRDYEIKAEQTALMWAVAEGHVPVVEELIQAGADFRTTLESGFTPLLFAIREGHMKVVKTLVKAGADVNKAVEPQEAWQRPGYHDRLRPGAVPLHLAVENAHFDLAAYLLEVGADPNAAEPTGYTALHAIVGARRSALGNASPPPAGSGDMTSLEFAEKLAAHGPNLNPKTTNWGALDPNRREQGATPFIMAAQTSDVEYMKKLTELGADPLVRKDNNSTALMVVGRINGTDEEVVEAMRLALDLGVPIDAVDDNGDTVMHVAASRNRATAIRFLADKGARIEAWNQENKNGATPLAIAVGHVRPGRFSPQPEAEAAIRELMIAAGVTPPTTFAVKAAQPGY